MRIRTIKPEFFRDGTITKLPPLQRLLFIGLWCCADRVGRLEDRPDDLGLALLPAERDIDVNAMLAALNDAKLIVRYAVDFGSFIQVVNFEKHQRITGKELEQTSKFPPPPEVCPRVVFGVSQVSPRSVTESQEGKGKEGKGTKTVAPSSSTTKPPALVFPCNGTQKTWDLTAPQIDEWMKLYPTLDIIGESKRALAWVNANGKKTARGMPAYLVRWFNRSNDSQRSDSKAAKRDGAYVNPVPITKPSAATEAYAKRYAEIEREEKATGKSPVEVKTAISRRLAEERADGKLGGF